MAENTESSHEPQLKREAKEAIRSYMLTLVALPGGLIAVIVFFLGFAVRDMAINNASISLENRYLPEMTRKSDELTMALAKALADSRAAERKLREAEEVSAGLKSLKNLQDALEKGTTAVQAITDSLLHNDQFKQQIVATAQSDRSTFVRYGDNLALECDRHPGLHLHAGSDKNVSVQANALSSPYVRWTIQRAPNN
jgi:hypothetical protein